MALMTQTELELTVYGFGRERAAERMEAREKAGRGADNPYSQALYRRFVLPLAEAITAEQTKARGRGRKPGHLQYLAPLHAENTAMVVVRAAVVHLVGHRGDNARILFASLGEAAYHEHLLEHFSSIDPDLFHQLTQGFAKRMSRDQRYRLNVVRDAARSRAEPINLPEWDGVEIERLGIWMADALASLGLLEIETITRGPKDRTMVSTLTQDALAVVASIKAEVIESSPYFTPCVEPPADWVSFDDGGYHTPEMRRLLPVAVKSSALGRDALAEADLSRTLAALNVMQRTAWSINRRVLDTMHAIGGRVNLGEVLAQGDDPKPQRPEGLAEDTDVEDMTEEQVRIFRDWKRATAKWYARARERTVKWGRYRQAMVEADKFRDYPAVYFVYFCDFRDRKYALASGVSPQGSDLQKALLHAAEGQPLHDQDAWDWFHITGANRFGYDKVDLPSRIAWCAKYHDDILASAEDPAGHQWWTTADKPLQFLAWAFEYADLHTFGRELFLSRVSVGMDGSCNGLQNFSAMLRDEVGGLSTNLIPSPTPQDIYGAVAVRTESRLLADTVPPEDDKPVPKKSAGPDDPVPMSKLERWHATRPLRQTWLAHGINRYITKRPVMTLPYGSTRFSCTEFIIGDYLEEKLVPEFDEDDYFHAASYLGGFVWDSIGDVVKKAVEAMVWLQTSASAITQGGAKVIRWTTPTGFPVVQTYWEDSSHQINTKLCGRQKVWVRRPTAEPNKLKHRNGISPNFIHSMDAAHLTRVAGRLAAEGVDWVHMVHDDFGVRPGDAGRLYRIIREEFVAMYTDHDPLSAFAANYPEQCPEQPERGSLDLRCVLDSPFFFS